MDGMHDAGALSIIQVCTDMCNVMKAAWRMVEELYLWVRCTCCGPHVLSFELKDIAKIPQVADVM
eukprot:4579782-Pleurochrysis_carterae.AAC.1